MGCLTAAAIRGFVLTGKASNPHPPVPIRAEKMGAVFPLPEEQLSALAAPQEESRLLK